MKKTITFLATLLVVHLTFNLFGQNLDEGFEGALFPPKGWTVINKSDPNGWVRTTYANYVISGSAATYIKNTSGAYSNWLITPRMTPTEGDETISFYAKNIGNGQFNAFNVKLSTTGTAEEDFNLLLANNVQTTQLSNKYEYDLSSYRGQNVYVAIQAIIGSDRYLSLDDFAGPALRPHSLDAAILSIDNSKDFIGLRDIVVSLQNNGTTDLTACTISYSVNGSTPTIYNWTGLLTQDATEQVTIAVDYDFQTDGDYLIEATVVLDGDEVSHNNSQTKTVNYYGSEPLPYFEGFEYGHTNGGDVANWWQESLNGSFSWMAEKNQNTYNRAPYTGEWNASLYQNNTDWMFSPKPIYLEAEENYKFSMYARTDKTTGANISVAYGTDPNSEAMQNSIVAATEVTNGDYQKISAIFIPAASGYYYLGIKGQVGSSTHYLSIDDIALNSVYMLNYAADANGSIAGEALQAIEPGANGTAVTAVANVGYHFVQWSDGVSTNPRTDIELSADLSVVAQFAINTYTIAVSAGDNGEITPTTNQAVEHGSNASFSITPNEGFYLASVLVDGESVGLVSDYSFNNISNDHSIGVTFTDTESTMHVLTATAGENGSISPSGEVPVAESGDVTFSITSNPGYTIKDVLVDGTSVGSVSSYTFENITATHSIVAEFENFNALHFDGTDDYVSFPELPTSIDLSKGFSFTAWVKWDAFSDNECIVSLGNGTSGHSDDILLRTHQGIGILAAEVANGSTNYILETDTEVVVTDAWYHLALTINPIEGSSNSDITVYLNGAAIKSGSTTTPRNIERTKVWLGRSHWTGDSYFKGSMDEVSFWSNALTKNEIVNAMKDELAGTETGLIGYYGFNQGIAGGDNSGKTTLNDASSFCRNGTLNSFALTGVSSNWVQGYETSLTYEISSTNGRQSGGNTVSITTTNSKFGNGSDITSITVGGVAAGITEQTATSVTITLPSGSEGAKDIVIVSESVGTITLPGAYTYNPAGMINEAKLRTGGPYISAGNYHSMALKADGSVAVWGRSDYGQLNVPTPNSDFVAVSAGDRYCLALKADGSISGWGRSANRQTAVSAPNSDFVAISAADYHSLGLKEDGSVVGWGENNLGQLIVPAPNSGFVAIAAGYSGYSLGLKDDGRIEAWGRNDYGQTDVPAPNTNFVAMAAGHHHALGLKDDGTIVAWGRNDYGLDVPAPNSGFVAIAAGGDHSLGLKADGSIVAWGNNSNGQLDVPSPNADFVAISAGTAHSLGLKADGNIVAWGDNRFDALNVPDSDVDFGLFEYGVSPSYGVYTGGYEVTINGTNLGNGTDITEVTLCDVAVQEIVSQSATQIVVRVGATATVGRGDVRVVSTSFGETVKSNAFTYLRAEQAPLVFEPESPQPYRVRKELSTSGGSGTGAVSYRVISGPGTMMNETELYVSAGSGTIVVSATKAQDGLFYATSATATVEATRGVAILTLGNLAQTYDGTPKSVTVTTNPSGMPVDLITYDGSETPPTEIGSYTVVATVDLEYWVGSATGTLVISLAEQTIDFPALSDQIMTNVVTLSATASSGLSVTFEVVSGPAVIDGSSLSFTGSGTVVITASQAGNQYWKAASVTHTFLVSKVNPNVTEWPTASAITYGEALSASTLSGGAADVSGLFKFANPEITPNAGTENQNVTFVPENQDLYSTVAESISVSVNTKSLTVSNAVVADKSYDGTQSATIIGATLIGVINDDDVALSNETVGTFASINVASNISVSTNMSLNGTASSNYSITQPTGLAADITAKPITVTANANQSKVYGEADPLFSFTTNVNLISGDDFSGALSRETGENVGTSYAITQGTLSAGTNYSLSFIGANFEITKATLTATAEDKTKMQGEANPVFTVKLSGFVLGNDESDITELPTASCTADENSGPGDYPIIVSGGSAGNYAFSYAKGNLTVELATAINATDKIEFKVWPNPFTSRLVVSSTANINRVVVTNLTGKPMQVSIQKNANSQWVINTSSLKSGVYLIKLYSADGKRVVTKVVKE